MSWCVQHKFKKIVTYKVMFLDDYRASSIVGVHFATLIFFWFNHDIRWYPIFNYTLLIYLILKFIKRNVLNIAIFLICLAKSLKTRSYTMKK